MAAADERIVTHSPRVGRGEPGDCIRLLGPVEVEVAGAPLRLGGRKERAVLAVLALDANRVVSESRLVDAIWRDEPPPSVTKTLRAYISRLRRLLAGSAFVVEGQPGGYVLRAPAGMRDVDEVARLRAEGTVDALRAAQAMWRGPSLGDLADRAGLAADVARLEELRLQIVEERLGAELAAGRHAESVAELEAMVAVHPLREHLWSMFITALYRSGRQAEALRAYQDLRVALADELGLEPGPTLQRLERAVLDHDPSLDLPSTTVAPAAPAPSHAPTPPPAPGNGAGRIEARPEDGWPVVGRDELVATVDEALHRGVGAVLAGDAGVGKTAVAGAVARRLEVGGFVVLRARATADSSRLPFGAVAHLLPAMEWRAGPIGSDSRLAVLQHARAHLAEVAAGRPLVLLVDDGHLLDRHSAALVHQLAATGVALPLVTVRTGEHPAGELGALTRDGLAALHTVPPLDQDACAALLTKVLGGPVDGRTRVRLFNLTAGNALFLRLVVTAERARGGLALDADGRWRLAGVPDVLNVREVIEDRLAGLTDAQRDVVELVAIGEPIGEDVLARLVPDAVIREVERRGLVRGEESGRRLEVRLDHPLVAEIVRASIGRLAGRSLRRRLADGVEATGARRREDLLRVALWRLESGSAADPTLLTNAAWRALFLQEPDLACRLADAARTSGGGFAALLALSAAYSAQGSFADAAAIGPILRAAATDDTELTRAVVEWTTNLSFGLRRPEDAETILAEVEPILADDRCRLELVAHRANTALLAGDFETSAARSQSVVDASDVPERVLVNAAATLAFSIAVLGRSKEASARLQEALTMAFALGDETPFVVGRIMGTQCVARFADGDPRAAISVAEQAYQLSVAQDAPEGRSTFSFVLARNALAEGRWRTALRWGDEALDALAHHDVGRIEAWCRATIALATALSGDLAATASALAAAEAADRPYWLFDLGLARAWHAWLAGSAAPDAGELALEAAEEALRRGQVSFAVMCFVDAARLGCPLEAAAGIVPLLDRCESDLAPAGAAFAGALAADDLDGLRLAAAQLEGIGYQLVAAEAWAAAAARSGDARDREEAERLAAASEHPVSPLLSAVS